MPRGRLGRLYGVGVGPGDPDLLTLKALKVIQKVPHLFVAASSKNHYSLALDIVRPHLPKDQKVRRLSFPMTYETSRLTQAWEKNAKEVLEALEQGEAAFLTLGDPTLYSTFGYLVRTLLNWVPELDYEVIPAVSAAQAAAARLKLSLAEGEDRLLLASAAQGAKVVRDLASQVETLVLYKVYRKAPDILAALKECGRLAETRGVSRCGMPQEKIWDLKELKEINFPYFTLFVVGGRPFSVAKK